MTSKENKVVQEIVEPESDRNASSAGEHGPEKRFSRLQGERIMELRNRFGLHRARDIARAMRISEGDAKRLSKHNVHEDKEND